tara:strand:+ start:848 stop:2083 length:1236 start_codon:yes stop_codon:yes gene_type:complete
MKKSIWIFLLVILVFLLGILSQYYFKLGENVSQIKAGADSKKPLYWVAPMDPTYRRDGPGKSPMGMDLVPVYQEANDTGDKSIKISSAVEQNLGVKTAIVSKKNLSRIINTVGYVIIDENRVNHINTYANGWVKKLLVKTTGEHVKKGQLLFEFFSPIIVSAQEEYLLALKSDNKTLIHASYKKLLTLGVNDAQIKQLKKTKKVMNLIKVFATQSGIVSLLNVREGEYVSPNKKLLVIEDLSKIWIIGEVFERQSQWVKKSQEAIAKLPYIPNKEWSGKVDYVYPKLDSKTHTLKVRFVFENHNESLKPNMYADVTIYADTQKDVLTIPKEAVIYTGQGARVIVSLGKGRYIAKPVKLGFESGRDIKVLSGLNEGDNIVISGQFLIDSESSLKSSFDRLEGNKSKKMKHNH